MIPKERLSNLEGFFSQWINKEEYSPLNLKPKQQIEFFQNKLKELSELDHPLYSFLYPPSVTAIPPEIGLMKNLKKLDLRNTKISFIPAQIGQLTSLCLINVTGKHLNVTGEHEKDVSLGRLKSFSAEIGCLTNLISLYGSHNHLASLPEMAPLVKLKLLCLANNEISSLSQICFLKNLKTLDLQYNHINLIPSEIGHLSHLTDLDLSS